ncbi:hypothetical protein BGW39_009837 [Mortierella sp. 14UC]|nr:hypothetical protein BGW39_009837 [Mortierella sp. 14UC]
MAYLIEILQSLQKEHCGCDLVKGCYCGQDGIEDHEGKSPCYVCGEWYPDRPDLMRTGGGGGGGHEGDMDSTRRQQGKSWHEQGSLRHHVAEAKVKKWLDSVWKPPLAPATTPEQENVKQFGLRSQEDLRQCFDHPHYQHRQQQQQQQQQHSARMEPGRPWSVHDVEIEARSKSCSRNNSASSNHSMSFVASPSAQYPSATTSPYSSAASPQQDLSGSAYGYGSSSGQWHFTTSPATAASSPSDSPLSKPVRATPPSQRAGRILWAPPSEAYGFSSLHADSQGYSQARVRTMSRSDTPPPSGNSVNYLGSPISSMRPSTPPVMRSSSYHTNHVSNTASNNNSSGNSIDRNGRSKPVRASTTNSTFSIPQEILNPNYRSPTFRIKSWSPAPSSSSPSGASPSSAFSPFTPRLSFSKDSSSSPGDSQPGKKQTLDGWTGAGAKVETKPLLSTPSSISSAQESVLKSSKMGRSDQEDCCMVLSPPPEASGQQGNTRENPTSRAPASAPTPASRSPVAGAGLGAGAVGVGAIEGEEVKKNAPFQFNFTSSRFRAAVQAKASMDSLKSAAGVHGRVGGGGVQSDSVQKSAAVLNEEVLRVQSGSTTMTVTDNGSHKEDQRVKSKATTSGTAIPIPVAVVIVTEEIVLSETDMDLQEPAPTPAPTSATAFLPSKAPPTSTGLTSSRSTNSIQNSAPLSSPTPLASSEPTPFSSLSSSSASTSTSTSALTSASSSNCSLGPKSPNKNNCPSNGAGDVQRATSWSSFHMLMQTMTVTAATTLTAATAVPPQCGGVLLHVDASPSSS